MKKNPFSIYDFMGYLFPGLFVLYVIYYFHSLDWDFYQIANINNLGKAINRTGDKFNFEKSVLIIIIAYVIGHLISYTSSLTVEILSNRFFGYPSKYLLQEDRPKYSELWKNYFKIRIESSSKIWKILKKAISYIAYGFIFLPQRHSSSAILHQFSVNSPQGFRLRRLSQAPPQPRRQVF